MDVADPAIGDRLMSPVNIVADIAATHHWPRLVAPIPLVKPFADFSLALCQFFGDTLFHSKRSFLSVVFGLGRLLIH